MEAVSYVIHSYSLAFLNNIIKNIHEKIYKYLSNS
jgi:hypothetical protein